ncbi:MAG: Electron transport complex protein RnfG [Syntrophaceae bacterium PtaU1.Bin231]|nr:MAG: Electron transport complex protein RnfG [Syntrophaceae bacterium PtaU1.Bin231]
MLKILKLAFTLTVFCVVSAGALAYVFMFTGPKIEANAKLAFERSLKEVLPGAETFNPGKDGKVFEGIAAGKPVGIAVLVAPRGYSGSIRMLVGVDGDLKVKGIKVLDQKETPGLGTNILKPQFLGQFIGKSSADKLEPKKDVEAITGATISTRGVCEGVRAALTGASEFAKGAK